MTGSGMTQTNENSSSGLTGRSDVGTPSTSAASTQSPGMNMKAPATSNIQDAKGDDNQWIKKPRGLGVLGQQIIESGERVEDPVSLHEKLGEREFSIL